MAEEQQKIQDSEENYQAIFSSMEGEAKPAGTKPAEIKTVEPAAVVTADDKKPKETNPVEQNVNTEAENLKKQLAELKDSLSKKEKEILFQAEQLNVFKQRSAKEEEEILAQDILPKELEDYPDEIKTVFGNIAEKNKILHSKLKEISSFIEEQKSKNLRKEADEHTQKEFNNKFNSDTLPEILKVEPEYMKFMSANSQEYFQWANSLSRGLKEAYTNSLDANDLLAGLRAFREFKKAPSVNAAEQDIENNKKQIEQITNTPLSHKRQLGAPYSSKLNVTPREAQEAFLSSLDKAEAEGRL